MSWTLIIWLGLPTLLFVLGFIGLCQLFRRK